MSPEGMAHALDSYVEALEHQVSVAEAFFFGRLTQGMEGLMGLPQRVKERIDQLIWVASGGSAIDPTEKQSQELIASAIMRSLDERMGM